MNRFGELVSQPTLAVYEHALCTIRALGPATLQSGLKRARAIGGSTQRAVLYFGLLDCALTLQRDDTLLEPTKAWDLYTAHISQLAQCSFDSFVFNYK